MDLNVYEGVDILMYNWFTPLSIVLCIQQLVSEKGSLEEILTARGRSRMVDKRDTPLFDRSDYGFWKTRMERFLVSLRFGVCKSVETRYTMPNGGPSTDDEIKAYENNGKARYALLSGLSNIELVKVMNLKSVRDIWKKLESIYEGDNKTSKLRCRI